MLLGDSLVFGAPRWLWALLLVPAAIGLFLYAERAAARRLARLIAVRLRARLSKTDSPVKRRVRFALIASGLAGLILALAKPQLGYEQQLLHRRGLDLIIIADVSKSMLATDVLPSRLGRARLAILDLLDLLPGDRVGLVAFAGTAFLQAPLTIDYDAIRSAVNELDPDLIPRGGTNIAAAIDLAIEAFGKAEESNRAILLMTDGEELEDDALKAAGRAADAGIKIFTVGIGSATGSLIPVPPDAARGTAGDFVRDSDGKLVTSKLDEKRLQAIAAATGGSYLHLTSSPADMKAIADHALAGMQHGEIDARFSRRPIERYQWPLGFALLCLAASTVLGERRRGARVNSEAVRPAIPVLRVLIGALALSLAAGSPRAARAADLSPSSAMDAYNNGRFDDAYKAYEELLKRNPKSGKLQFNAGASAYMAKKYDGALDAFTGALKAPDADPTLQAKTLYNLGNTLYRRGEGQADMKEKVNDWRNAIDYYESVLQTLPADDKSSLRADAIFNRDLVKKRLEELQKKQPPSNKPSKDSKQKQDQDKGQQKNQQGDKGDQPKPDPSKKGQENSPDKGQGQTGDGQAPQDKQDQGQGSSSKSPPQPNQNGNPDESQNPPPGSNGDKGDKSDDKTPDQSSGDGSRQASGDPNHPTGGSQNGGDSGTPPPAPEQSSPRPQGDMTARENKDQTQKSGQPSAASAAASPASADAAAGRMTAEQARSLLSAMRDEDDPAASQRLTDHAAKHDEPVYKDW